LFILLIIVGASFLY
ncbi:YjcZ family sporulation protein, partial [Bacillus spizizenii]